MKIAEKYSNFFEKLTSFLAEVAAEQGKQGDDAQSLLIWAQTIMNPPFQVRSWGSTSPVFPEWLKEESPQSMADIFRIQQRVLEESLSNTMITKGDVTILWLDKGRFGQS